MNTIAFSHLVTQFRQQLAELPDKRQGDNTHYEMEGAALSAFSVFFTQSPSFLAFQRAMQDSQAQNNAQNVFGVYQIPSDNHIRDLMDGVAPEQVLPIFNDILETLSELGYLALFRSFNNDLLIPLDGTQYHSSKTIHCSQCSQAQRNGEITYSHTVITPVIAAPDNNKVIPLEPEFITPQDGHNKQDCENAAAKRWLARYGARSSKLGATILGDDLYSRQPLCEAILEQNLNFILVCKPSSHKTLYEWVEGLEHKRLTRERRRGKKVEIDSYRFVNQVPLRDGDDALVVNWCELTTTRADGSVVYRNAFATNHATTDDNVIDIVTAGRTRWKVENENNNTLKTKGYHFAHNFGHGKQHLSAVLATLNLLAFLFHTVLDMSDAKYRLIRQKLPTRQTFFDDIRALTRYMYFEDWDSLLIFMILESSVEKLPSKASAAGIIE